MLDPVVRLVDDDERLLDALEFVLRIAGFTVAKYTSAEAFLAQDDFSRPGCIVLDVRMQAMSGPECQQEIRKRQSTLPILFLSGHADVNTAISALKYGAADFLQKPVEAEVLVASCKRLVDWHITLLQAREVWQRLQDRVQSLTPRELEVAQAVAQGLANKVIADHLGVSEQGIKFHRSNIYKKLEVHSAVEIQQVLNRAKEPQPSARPGELLSMQAETL